MAYFLSRELRPQVLRLNVPQPLTLLGCYSLPVGLEQCHWAVGRDNGILQPFNRAHGGSPMPLGGWHCQQRPAVICEWVEPWVALLGGLALPGFCFLSLGKGRPWATPVL